MANRTSVMLIEDDIRASYTLEATINNHSDFAVVCVCETQREAMRQYPLYHPGLVFVDITLPDGNGIDIIRQLREANADCDFIMTTAEREAKTVELAVKLGVFDYLVKPIRMSRVQQALTDYLTQRQKLAQGATIEQGDIDAIFRKHQPHAARQTPKGIDATTLALLNDLLNQSQQPFSAEEIGQRLNISRVTARRYLEYLESESVVSLTLNYNTGGRPQRLYQVVSKTDR